MTELRERKNHATTRPLDSHSTAGESDSGPSTNESPRSDVEKSWDRAQLGYGHWLGIVLFLASLACTAVWLDSRRPLVQPADQHQRFSEERARVFLNQLVELGPRPSGSEACEVKAVELITAKIANLTRIVDSLGVNRLELDIQRPTGCYALHSVSGATITFCHHNVTNVVARLGPRGGPAKHSLLLNCHFDTVPDSPGATDDATACATSLEVLEVFAHSPAEMEHDLVFLFNGAEENFLQGSQPFITKHPWRHTIRGFINMDACGADGREVLFRVGPSDSWLLKVYLDNAPHPSTNVLAQDLYEWGTVPSITDFQMFREYGRVPGLDIAYLRNGWYYHTEFDQVRFIETGTIQHAGENVLDVTRAILRSPHMNWPKGDGSGGGGKWVYYDFIGLFKLYYSMEAAAIINYTVIAALVVTILYKLLHRELYSFMDLGLALGEHLLATVAMLATGIAIVFMITVTHSTLMWHGRPWLLLPLYAWPMLNAGLWVHLAVRDAWAGRRKGRSKTLLKDVLKREAAHYDATMLVWAVLLLPLTVKGIASAYIYLIHLAFPLLRQAVLAVIEVLSGSRNSESPTAILIVQMLCLSPAYLFLFFGAELASNFFIPILARSGNVMNPEYAIMGLAFVVALTIVASTSNLIWLSCRMSYLLRCSVALNALLVLIIVTTRLGWPYVYSEEHPHLRRIATMHVKRSVYDFNGTMTGVDVGLWTTAYDFRGVDDLPEHSFLQASFRPKCEEGGDEMCHLPYYYPRYSMTPPEMTLWAPIPAHPNLARPLEVNLLDRRETMDHQVVVSLSIKGGADKLSYHITPLEGYRLVQWSIGEFNEEEYGPRQTYFVYFTSGSELSAERNLTLVLENTSGGANADDPCVEFVVATQYVHGAYQYSEVLRQLRTLIRERREKPHHALGYWRWGITMIGGVAEVVVKKY